MSGQDVERLYQDACESGDVLACGMLGLMHETGDGVARDLPRAAELYGLACDGGDLGSCTNLALLHQLGVGVPQDFERALALYRRGCDGGQPLACDRLETWEQPDPVATGRIIGRVTREDGGGALPSVRITVRSLTEREVRSDPQGRFSVTDVESGLVQLQFRGLGYATRTETLVVPPGRTVEVSAAMSPEPIELAPIDVVVSPMEVSIRSPYLERMGFYRRLERPGHRFTRDELELFQPRTLSDLLFRVPGVDVTYDADADGIRAHLRRGLTFTGPCFLEVYIDGVRTPVDIEQIPVEWLEAVEIYRGVNGPIEYASGPCGAILLWTQR